MMKKFLYILLPALLLCALSAFAQADTLSGEALALKEARTLQEQLDIINRIADDHADEVEAGAWDYSLTVEPDAEDMPEGTLPEDWEAYGYKTVSGFPEDLRDRRFLFLNSDRSLASAWYCRLPEQMRARTVEEAEYALVVDSVLTPSGYTYIPPANSSHRDYSAYILDLKTGEAVRFWYQRNSAKTSGKWGHLDGDEMSGKEIWEALRSEIWGQIRLPLEDGAVLIFGISGKNCFLKGYEGKPVHVEVPADVQGHPVVEIGTEAFNVCRTLQSVRLPESIRKISASAFRICIKLEAVNLPGALEEIGDEAFNSCEQLRNIEFPDGIKRIGRLAFFGNVMLTEVTLPASLTDIGSGAFRKCGRLSRVVMEHAVTFEEENLFDEDLRLVCMYLADGARNSAALGSIPADTVIYAPEGSYFLEWARENGQPAAACESPSEMPAVDYTVENGMEFLLFGGEAGLSGYVGQDPGVIIPETAAGLPVTRILNMAVYCLEHVTSVTIPASIREISGNAIYAPNADVPLDIYIENPETVIGRIAIRRYGNNNTPVTIHAPEGSTAQRYVTETNDDPLVFEPWGQGVNPDVRVLENAMALAEQVQESAVSFWQSCDQTEYSWLARFPGYEIRRPEAAAVLHLTSAQFDDLALLMAGEDRIARVFATLVNTQWNLPYARAAAKTAREAQFKPVPDGSCRIAVLCYRSDLVFFILQQDGSAQASLICSSPSIISGMTPEYISGIAAQYGISGDCRVYTGDQVLEMLGE